MGDRRANFRWPSASQHDGSRGTPLPGEETEETLLRSEFCRCRTFNCCRRRLGGTCSAERRRRTEAHVYRKVQGVRGVSELVFVGPRRRVVTQLFIKLKVRAMRQHTGGQVSQDKLSLKVHTILTVQAFWVCFFFSQDINTNFWLALYVLFIIKVLVPLHYVSKVHGTNWNSQCVFL